VEKSANSKHTGGVIDQVKRQAPASHQQEHLLGGPHPVHRGDRRFMLPGVVSDGTNVDPRRTLPQGEGPSWRRWLIGFRMRLRARRGHPASATQIGLRWRQGCSHQRVGSSSAASIRAYRGGAGARTSASSQTASPAQLLPWNSERRRGGCLGSESVVAASKWLFCRWLHSAQSWLAISHSSNIVGCSSQPKYIRNVQQVSISRACYYARCIQRPVAPPSFLPFVLPKRILNYSSKKAISSYSSNR
jgi:hypothetical protein